MMIRLIAVQQGNYVVLHFIKSISMNRKIYTIIFLLLAVTGFATTSKYIQLSHALHFSDCMNNEDVITNNKNAIKLYPNPSFNGTVTVTSNIAKNLNFYIFDLEGILLHQTILKENQKHTINNLKKGIYMYDAFLNDESIEHGKIVVK